MTPQECFIERSLSRLYIALNAFLVVLDSKLVPKSKRWVKASLQSSLVQDVAEERTLKRPYLPPKRNEFLSPVTVFPTSVRESSKVAKRVKRNILWRKENTNIKKKSVVLKNALQSICMKHFNGNKNEFLCAFSELIKPSKSKNTASFDGYFRHHDMIHVLTSSKGKP